MEKTFKMAMFLLVTSSSLRSTGASDNLTCYSCSTDTDGTGCNDPFSLTKSLVTCTGTCYVSTKFIKLNKTHLNLSFRNHTLKVPEYLVHLGEDVCQVVPKVVVLI